MIEIDMISFRAILLRQIIFVEHSRGYQVTINSIILSIVAKYALRQL